MRTVALSVSASLILSGAAFSALAGNPPPVFTGNVEADFTNIEVIPASDPGGVGDVGISGLPEGTVSGWDMKGVSYFYDRMNDVLYVGIDFAGIAGDADGDGDPSVTSPELRAQGGADVPSLGVLESIVVGFDTDLDGLLNVVAGVPAFGDLGDFTTATAVPGLPPMFAFDVALPQNTGTFFADPSAAAPDFEFTIPRFSELPGFGPLDPANESIIYSANVFAGSIADAGIGEDLITPFILTFGKVNFDDEPDGTLITDQYASEGLTIAGMSDCGVPGAFINFPFDNPDTDDIIPTSGVNVITTKCDPSDDSSDSGRLEFQFVNIFDGFPGAAIFFSIAFLDVEDSGTPGRGTAKMEFFNKDDMLIDTIPIPSGPNGNQFTLMFPLATTLALVEPVKKTVGTLGDSGDSAAADSICFNLEPPGVPMTIDIQGPAGAARRGQVMDLFIGLQNVKDVPTEAIAVITAGRAPAGRSTELVPPTLLRLKKKFDNTAEPVPLQVAVPQGLDPRYIGVPMRVRAKLLDPVTGRLIAQDVYDFTIGE